MPSTNSNGSSEPGSPGTDVQVPRLTDSEELAFALVLWKLFRQNIAAYSQTSKGIPFGITVESEMNAYRAMSLARKFGVSKEFMEVMMMVPVAHVELKWKDHEKWEQSKITEALSIQSSRIESQQSLPGVAKNKKRGGRPKKSS